ELREAAQAAGEREGIAEHARAEAAAALQAAREARDEALRRIRDMEGTGRGRGAEGDDRVGGGGGEGKGGGRSKEQQQQQQQQGGEMLAVPLPAAAAPHSTSVVASPAPSSPPLLPPLSGLSLSHSPRTPSSPRSSSAGSSEQATGGGEGLVGNSRAGGEGGSARGGEGGSSVVEVGGAKAREGLGGSAVRLSDLDVGGWGMAAGGVGLERLRAKVRWACCVLGFLPSPSSPSPLTPSLPPALMSLKHRTRGHCHTLPCCPPDPLPALPALPALSVLQHLVLLATCQHQQGCPCAWGRAPTLSPPNHDFSTQRHSQLNPSPFPPIGQAAGGGGAAAAAGGAGGARSQGRHGGRAAESITAPPRTRKGGVGAARGNEGRTGERRVARK
ncbi:unnamed protein product, partial [Closterium sp. NIES-54]